MPRRTKLEKFADLLTFPNVYQNYDPKRPELVGQYGESKDLKGNWREGHFKNQNPVWLELACGKGEYTLELGRRYPGINIIGVDVKGNRIWKGAKLAIEKGIANVAFLRTRIEQIDLFLNTSEINEIWITFPDPFVKKGQINRRLTAPLFLEKYRKILRPGGCVHLKTDSYFLFDYTQKVLEDLKSVEILISLEDLSRLTTPLPDLDIQTYYERMHISVGKKIKYLKWEFT